MGQGDLARRGVIGIQTLGCELIRLTPPSIHMRSRVKGG